MKIIDAHHHLWCPESDPLGIGYIWLKKIGAIKPFGDPTTIQRDYFAAEFIAEPSQHKIIGSVHVQADGAIADPVQESVWLEQHADEQQLPLVHVGFVDLTAANAEKTLLRYLELANFRGVRQIISKLADKPEISFTTVDYLHNQQWRDNFSLLAEHQLSFDLQLYPEQMHLAAEFLAQHPKVPVVIDHAGSPYDQTKAGLKRWQEGMAALAALPHCHVKLSGFGMFDQQWSTTSIQPIFDHLWESFGAERIMFGSNYPVDKLMKSYDEIVDSIVGCARKLQLDDQQISALFFDNAKSFYRIEL